MLLGMLNHISNSIKVLNKLINVKHPEKLFTLMYGLGQYMLKS